MTEGSAIVLDCGSSWCRAGLSDSCQESESVIIRNVIGYPKDETTSEKEFILGDAALSQRENFRIRYPYQFGHIASWDDVELMWQILINDKLKVKASDHPFLIIHTGFIPRLTLERTAEIFFEHFDAPFLRYKLSGEMCLLSSSRTTGTVVEIGAGASFPVPVVNGYELRLAKQRTEFSGNDLTTALSRMVSKTADSDASCIGNFELMNTIKEKYCYCACNYEEELKNFTKDKQVIHNIPGQSKSVTLGPELFQCPEALFKPSLANREFPGLHEIVFKCIKLIDDDHVQRELFSNIVLCGGSSMFPGLGPRLQQELHNLAISKGYSPKISVSVNPYEHAAFEGGKICAREENFMEKSFSKEEYDEKGPYPISNICM